MPVVAVPNTRFPRGLYLGNMIAIFGTLTPSGTYPAANGDPIDFGVIAGFSNKQPLFVEICGKAGFVYTYDYVNKSLRVWVNTAGGANAALGEHTNVGYVAGVTGDIITFVAFIPKM